MQWPEVDFEVCTAFSFDDVAALLNYEIDLLITPDPLFQPELTFTPAFDYELVLVVHEDHPLAGKAFVEPQDLLSEELITVPVTLERLDIYTRFLVPAHCRPRSHSTVETTDLMLRLSAAGRGVSVLPDWLLHEQDADLAIRALRLGPNGLHKSIHLGLRRGEEEIDYIAGFMSLARNTAA